MNANTRTALAAILAGDATITKEDAAAVLKRLDGTERAPARRVIRTKEACALLGVGVKTLRAWAARGRIVPVYGGNENFRIGYTEDSVRAILEGRAVERDGKADALRGKAAV